MRIAVRLLVAVAVLLVPATAGAQGVTKTPLTFAVTTGPNNDTPCRIVADLYTPAGVSKNAPAPAIMATNGFGGSKDDFTTLGPTYAKRGYVFLAYSGLGFGNSGCKITLDDPDWDGRAGSQLVSFLGGTKAAENGLKIDYVAKDGPGDPRMGMIGGSYGGQIQFAVAGVDQRVDALVPQITWSDLSYSLTPNNTDFKTGVTYDTPGVVKLDWPLLFSALGIGQGFAQAIQNGDTTHLGVCPNFADQVCPGLLLSAAQGFQDPQTLALLRHASVASYLPKIKIPVFLAQGQSDTLFNLQEAVATYKALRAQGTPVKMLWRSAGHSGGGLGKQESDASNLENAYESRLALEWFDFYLYGQGDPPDLDFGFLRDWALPASGDAAPAVGVTPTYPSSTDRALQLSGDGTLVSSGAKPGRVTFASVSLSPLGSGNGFTNLPVPDTALTSGSFTGAPLTEDFDLVGVPRVTVKVDAPAHALSQGVNPAGKLVLFAKLVDVAPDGTETLPRTLLSAARVGDVNKPVTIELPGVAHRFAKGHRMRLVFSTNNSTNRGNAVTGPVSIVIDPAAPGALTVPQLGAQLGATGSGRNGLTRFTPPDGAPAPQTAKRPKVVAGSASASLPSSRSCKSRRSFTIRLRQPRGDALKSAVVTVNGKRVKTLRGKRLRAKVNLRGLPRKTVRVTVTAKTRKGRTLRSTRTYRTCVTKRARR
jgi:predicted acyl esterase